MKKLDKLIIRTFLGPFLITFFVVVFILLMVYMLKYFDDFIGKDLGFEVFAELIMYFSINMTPVAFPLAVLLSSLMTFGNLGEHFELTAIKSAGISLIRAMQSLFILIILLAIAVYFSNNYIVPKANLNAYSLLYDIKQTKPSIDIKEGAFYGGIPGYSIKANKKFDDDKSLGDLIIYNHSKGKGNKEVILADSALMYTILGDKYLVMELFNGKSYTEDASSTGVKDGKAPTFVRNEFYHNKVVFSLASFEMERTDKELFSSNRLMKNDRQLRSDVDSMRFDILESKKNIFLYLPRFFNYHLAENESLKPSSVEEYYQLKQIKDSIKAIGRSVIADSASINDSIAQEPLYKEGGVVVVPELQALAISTSDKAVKAVKEEENSKAKKQIKELPHKTAKNIKGNAKINKQESIIAESYDSATLAISDSIFFVKSAGRNISLVDKARFAKNRLRGEVRRIESRNFEINVYNIEANSKLSQAVACIVMFLIGAPLGAIIKKGGLGFPVLVSIIFFIISYVINTSGVKLGRAGEISDFWAVWASNFMLLPFGLYFLKQAQNDSRLLEKDNYLVIIDKVKALFKKN
jgi:lipopolysaccharide export system permease protein